VSPSLPAPTWRVPLSDVAVDDDIVAAALDAVRSGWWSMGPRVAEFEQEFAEFCDARHALAVANGTAAIHLALLAAGCGPGDEVILPSLTFVAAANTVVHVGATPVFADVIGPHDLNVDSGEVASLVGPRTKAILAFHYGGFACDMGPMLEVAERHGLAVIEDAAHAPGARWGGRSCGTIGLVGCFSFFSNKNLPVGEGGMVVTNDDEVAGRIRLLRSHGMTTLTWDRQRGHAAAYDVLTSGLNYRLDEVRAAVGLVQLRRLPTTNAGRAKVVAAYRERLAHVDGLIIPFEDHDPNASSHHLAAVLLPEGTPRGAVQETMRERGVQTSVHYPPIHRFSAFADLGAGRALPRTDEVADRILTLPLFAHMTEEQLELVVEALGVGLDTARETERAAAHTHQDA
jgi:dTDP-4-amino-4,6-dideoxygalactose transaminase